MDQAIGQNIVLLGSLFCDDCLGGAADAAIAGKQIAKVIVVPKKLVNIVVR